MQQQRLAQFLLFSLSGLALAGAARAQDKPDWRISGFGTLGVVHASEREADYTSSVFKANGAGATRRTASAAG